MQPTPFLLCPSVPECNALPCALQGTLDCVLCRDTGERDAKTAIHNLYDALRSPGTLIIVSHSPPDARLHLLNSCHWESIQVIISDGQQTRSSNVVPVVVRNCTWRAVCQTTEVSRWAHMHAPCTQYVWSTCCPLLSTAHVSWESCRPGNVPNICGTYLCQRHCSSNPVFLGESAVPSSPVRRGSWTAHYCSHPGLRLLTEFCADRRGLQLCIYLQEAILSSRSIATISLLQAPAAEQQHGLGRMPCNVKSNKICIICWIK